MLFTLDSGGGRGETEPVDFQQLVRDALEERQTVLTEQALQVKEEYPDGRQLVLADSERLAFLVRSLIDNAIKFNRRGGLLKLNLTCENNATGRQLVWRVHHDGGTVPVKAAEAIFEQYTQLGDVRSGKPTGVGVGLSICKAVVDRMGGTIYLEPPSGKGTTIVVSLPLLAETGDITCQAQ